MNTNIKTRKEKIQFLKDLKSGKISLKDIPPTITGMIAIYKDEYLDMKTGETLTKEQFEKIK
jgi:hypothetical protein